MRYYVYVLQSSPHKMSEAISRGEIDKQFYVGYTLNLKQRLENHNNGKVHSTRERMPLKLVYYEFCLNPIDATKREKYLKTAWGKQYIKNRIKNYLTG